MAMVKLTDDEIQKKLGITRGQKGDPARFTPIRGYTSSQSNNTPSVSKQTGKLPMANKGAGRLDAIIKSNDPKVLAGKFIDTAGNLFIKSAQEREAARANAPKIGTKEYLDYQREQLKKGPVKSALNDKLIVKVAEKADIDPTQYSPMTQEFIRDQEEARARAVEGLSGGKKMAVEAGIMLGDVLQKQAISKATGIPYGLLMAADSGSDSAQYALASGASANKATLLGVGAGGITAGTESIGGIGGTLATKIGQRVVKALPAKAASMLTKLADNYLAKIVSSGVAEGTEEGVEYALQLAWQNLVMDENTPFDVKEALYNMGMGAIMGGVFEAGRGGLERAVSGGDPTVTRREQRALNALSEKTGVKIQVDDDIEGSNGYFDRSTNTLHISRNSNNAVYQVAAHEIAHSIESNPDEWNQLYEIANANLSEDARSKLEYVLQKTGYTDAEMQSEVVSHYIQQCVTDIKSFEQLVGVNRTLAQRIVDAFESFVRKLTGQRSVGNDSDTEYLREIMGDITPEQAQQTLAQMKKALAAGGETTGEGVRRSFYLARDNGAIAQAEQMERDGANRAEIWQATGVIRDTKGNWVAEMDDSNVRVNRNGELYLEDNPIYQRYQEANKDFEGFTEKLFAKDPEALALYDEYNKLDTKPFTKRTLEDYVAHSELFDLYPDIKKARFGLHNLGDDIAAYYNPFEHKIAISQKTYDMLNGNDLRKEEAVRTIMHEIQHAIQEYDRRPSGASSAYWEQRGAENPREMYRNTAGEIEARETEARRKMTAEERKNTTPDLGWDRAVFADGGNSEKFVGTTADGIEVYETSKDTKKMSFADRKKAAKALVEEQYAGRTAKFLRNGHWDYAVFEKNIGKNLYNDTVSDGQGYNAKLNAFADGDVFTLVENSKYDDSKPEQKSHNADHWDYYVKTVQIDNRVYDVLVNIKYGYGKMKNIYSITLKENKKISPAAPVQNQESSADLGGQLAYSDSQYTQNKPVVNTQKSLKLSPEAIKQNADTAEQYFGTTINPKVAGYLTVNGKMLDFSGKKFGASGGYRTVDHREIRDALGEDYGGDSYGGGMVQFMAEGNIRLSPESGGINLSAKPNKVQEDQLARFIRTYGGEVIVDFNYENGDIDGSVEYPARTPASLILQEIRDYFDKGKLPEKFDYSRKLNREALQEMAERSRTGIPYAPGYVPKEARKPALPYNPNATDGYENRVNELREPIKDLGRNRRKKVGGYSVGMYTRNGSDDITISITTPDGDIIRDFVKGGKYWTNSQLQHEIASRIAEAEEYSAEEKQPAQPALPYNPNAPKPIPQNPAQGKFGGNTVGSAEANPNSYSHLQNQHGTIEPGENPSRVVDVPKKDADGNVVSLFARTGMESQHMPDELVEPFEQAVASGEFSHVVWSDKRAKRYAEGEVNKGFDHAWKQWRAVADGTKVATKDDIALGELLLANAMKDKQIDLAIQLTAELCAEATRAGQNVQAFRLLKKMTPEGQLFYLQKVTDKLNKQYEGRKDFDGINLNEDYVKELTEATTKEAMDKAVDKIKQNIADQTPVTFEDKWNAWRYLAMLGNVRTQVRNIMGNAVFLPVVKTKNLIATGIERAAGKRLPERTKALLIPERDKALISYGKNDFENVKADVAGGNKYTDQQDILSKRRIFKLENIERARIITNEVMEWGDRIFSKGHYATSLASYMKANKLNPDTITPEQLNKARNYAIKEAQKATFRDANAFASFLNATKKNMAAKSRNADTMLGKVGWKAAEAVAEGIVPFTKTPANIMARGIEYSPVGLLWNLATDGSKIKSGKMTAAEAIDKIAAGLTGTGLFALGCFLASAGAVTGAAGDDKEDKYNAMLGEQEYALKVGDGSYTIDWLAPAALPFFTGVAVYNELAENGKFELAQIFDAMSAIGEPLFELSMVQGIDSALGASKYSDQAPIISVLSNAALGYVGQGVPTSFGQMARAVDKTRRQTYYDPNYKGIVKEGLAVGQKQLAKTPGSFLLEPKVDMWGREQENEGGSFVGRLAYNMLSPGYASGNKATAVDKELQSLYKKTGETSVLPSYADKTFELPADLGGEKVKLNAKEYTEYAKTKGGKAYDIFDSVIGTKNWNSLSDDEKVEAASLVYKYANAIAKTKVSDYTLTEMEDGKVKKNKDGEVVYRDVAGKIQECEKAGIPAGVAIVAYVAQKDVKGDKDKKGNTIQLSASKNKKEAIDKMTPFINKKQRELLYDLFEVSSKVW